MKRRGLGTGSPLISHRDPITSLVQVDNLRRLISESAARTRSALIGLLSNENTLEAFEALKFRQVGFHPLDPRPLNFIEQLNQTLTCLVSLAAVEFLFAEFPAGTPYNLNFGTKSGSDIFAGEQFIAAEVFAAVALTNNRKLRRDVQKVAKTPAAHQFVFFYCPASPTGEWRRIDAYPSVRVISLSRDAIYPHRAGA